MHIHLHPKLCLRTGYLCMRAVCDCGVSRYRARSRANRIHAGWPCLSRTRRSDALTSLYRPKVDQRPDSSLTKKHLSLLLLHHSPKNKNKKSMQITFNIHIALLSPQTPSQAITFPPQILHLFYPAKKTSFPETYITEDD